MITWELVERRRDLVAELIKKKQAGDRSDDLLFQIQEHEADINYLLTQYHAQPTCPFCRTGKMLETGTKGRLGCERCQAVGLVGRLAVETVK